MNGAESVIRTAQQAGVELCLANPGTTEMHLVRALEEAPGIRAVLGLFEGVVTGAADGYGRMRDRPALSLLHLGPGLANGIANLHNARRARSPIVNLVGDQATWHLAADAPLTSDISSLARPVSSWLRSNERSAALGRDTADAIAAALQPPGGVSTLVIPADCAWGEGGAAAPPRTPRGAEPVPGERIDGVAEALRSAQRPLLLLGGPALRTAGLRQASRVAASSGARLYADTFPARLERGGDLPVVEKLPYFPEQALELLADVDLLVVAGTRAPVSFFAYPDVPSRLVSDAARVRELAAPHEAVVDALAALAEALPAAPPEARSQTASRPTTRGPADALPTGELNSRSLGAALAALQPDNAIVMDEGATSGLPYWGAAAAAPPHSYLALTGGAIGQGLPCATGAALACPERSVIALQADGSGMYTLQSLWTQAREGLEVKTVVCANRQYRILRIEMARTGVAEPGAVARGLFDLAGPELDWVALARGMGVPGERVDCAEGLVAALRRSLATPGPYLVEALLSSGTGR